MATVKKAAVLVALQLALPNVFGATVGSPELITTAPAVSGSTASGSSAGGQISADGRYVLFQSTASDLTSSSIVGGVVNLYLADRQQNSVTLISKNASGNGGANAACVNAAMSDDGKFVVFETTATNLVAADIDLGTDIYLGDVAAGTVMRVSEPKFGQPTIRRASSTNASISWNGERIVFKSGATDLVPTVAGTKIPLFFLYDRVAGTNQAIWSIDLLTGYTTNITLEPVISKSGTVVCFEATARNLVTLGATYGRQVYAYDLETSQLRILTDDVMPILNRPVATPADHYLRSVSSNGNVVVFLSDVPSSIQTIRTNYLFRHLIVENTTEILATNVNWTTDGAGPFPEVAMSADGQYVAFGIKGNIYRWDAATQTRELVTVSTNGNALTITNISAPFMSADGRYIAFASAATNLVEGAASTLPQLYRRDMETQTTVRVTSEPGGITATTGPLYDGSISDDGKIVFTSNDPDVVGGDLNGGPDCVIWDESKTPRISAISKIAADLKSTKPYRFLSVSTQPMSSNGKIVAFSGQLDGSGIVPEIWLRDRAQGTTKLISFVGLTGEPSTNGSYNAMVSGEGRWIAYETSASGIVSGLADTNGTTDVILYDSQAGVNRLVTKAATSANAAINGGELRAMSFDGRYLAISSAATTLVDPPVTTTGTTTGAPIYLWDRETGAFRLITRDGNGNAIRGIHTNVMFSPDSRQLALFAIGAAQYIDARTGQMVQASAGSATLLIHEIESGITRGYAVTSATNRVMAFSPDGAKLITTASGTATRGVWRIDLATGAEESVAFNLGNATALESSVGGQAVALSMDTSPAPFVGLLDITSGRMDAIAAVNAKYPVRPEINADGSIVIFQNYTNAPAAGDTNGYPNPLIYDISVQTLNPIAHGDGPSVGNILSGDGSTLLVLSQASGLVANDRNGSMDLIAYGITAPPRVYVEVNATSIDLRFSATASDFILESAAAVDGAPASWQAVVGNQSTEGGSIVVRFALSDSMRFFRLRK